MATKAPGRQAGHGCTPPGALVAVPGAHAVHALALGSGMKPPGSHSVQAEAPNADAYVPGTHPRQASAADVRPDSAPNVPGRHDVHPPAPIQDE